jgi:carboxymethylenebutenolidase
LNEHLVDIQTASGAIDTFVVHPGDDRQCPPVVIYMDVWACAKSYSITRAASRRSVISVVPNFYYRQGKIRNEYRNDKNQMITLDRLDEERRAQVLARLSRLSDSMVVEDTGKIMNFIDADRSARPNSAIGVSDIAWADDMFSGNRALSRSFQSIGQLTWHRTSHR